MVWCLCTVLAVQPALAQRQMSFIRDTEIEQYLKIFTTPILKTAGVQPDAVTMILVREDTLNAFVAGGQNIFVHTGLLMDTDLYQLIGVLAHETGHIAGGHLARTRDAVENATTIATILTLLGLAAAIGGGRGDVGTGVMAAGQEAARGSFFAYTRAQEGATDEAGMTYLETLGWPATGMLSMMEKLASQEYVPEARQVEYARTHPLTRDRIEVIRWFVQNESKFSKASLPAPFYDQHARMQAKLLGYLRPQLTLRRTEEGATDIPSRYARSIALFQTGEVTRALALVDGLIAQEPENPYFHELRGQILFEHGRAAEAVPSYRRAAELAPQAGMIRSSLGHALLEVYDDRLLEEAIAELEESARLERRSALTWRLLSSAYSRADRQPLLAYARAEEALARGDVRAAKFHADRAEQMLPAGSPEWLRAQDIRVLVESRVGPGPRGG